MFTSSSAGLWGLRLRIKRLNLWLLLPLYILTDLLASLSDLCEVILPRLGLPNYAGALHELVAALTDMPPHMPLVDIHVDEVDITCKRIEWRGR